MKRLRLPLGALALLLPVAATAHSFWLQPESHIVEIGEEAVIGFKIGDVGEEGDWSVYWERVSSFRLHGPDGTTDQLRAVRTRRGGDTGGAQLSIAKAGSYVLAFESNPSFSDLEAERFNRYVEHEGLTAIAAHRELTRTSDTNGTELYARRAKALLQVGDAQTGNVTEPVGQLLEIVPLANPFALGEGDNLSVQVLWRGEPLEGASLVVARPHADGDPLVLLTDADGKASFDLQWGSRYLLSVVWGVPAPNDRRADYFTIFSSLTFPSP